MKKRCSAAVAAPLLASVAVALLTGCHPGPEMKRCVDASGRVVDTSFCDAGPGSGSSAYRYYYGGKGSYQPGSGVSGGTYTPQPGHTYSTTNGTARGAFGSFLLYRLVTLVFR